MHRLRAWTLIGIAALASGLGAAAPAAAETAAAARLTVVSGLPAGHPALRIFREHFQADVARRLAAADGVRVAWAPAHDGVIAPRGAVLEAVEDGLADIGIIALEFERDRLPLQDITFHLPFTTSRCAVVAGAYHALHREVAGMARPWQQAGQFYLANITTDGYDLVAFRRLKTVDELRGLTVAMTGRVEGWLDGVGATPRRLPAGQLAGALEERRIDAALLPPSEIARLGLGRPGMRLLETELGAQTAFAVSMNGARFAGLPAPLRDALRAAAEAFVPAAAEAYCAAGADALAAMQRDGMRSQQLFRSRREEWAALLPPLGRIWSRARERAGYAGDAALRGFMDNLRAAGITPVRAWDRDAPPTN